MTEAKQAFLRALERREYDVTVIQDSPTFCRMVVRRAGDEVLVDLAIDSPPNRTPTVTVLGPTLAPLELAGRKLSPCSAEPRPATSPTSTSSPNASERTPCWNRPMRWTQASTRTFPPR